MGMRMPQTCWALFKRQVINLRSCCILLVGSVDNIFLSIILKLFLLVLTLRLLMSYIYMEHPFLMFLDHTQGSITVGRTPLDEWSARRRDLYLTTHDTHNRQISMPPVGFEPEISIYTYNISSLRINDLTLILLTWRKWWAPNNASKQQMGFNSAFKGLIFAYHKRQQQLCLKQ